MVDRRRRRTRRRGAAVRGTVSRTRSCPSARWRLAAAPVFGPPTDVAAKLLLPKELPGEGIRKTCLYSTMTGAWIKKTLPAAGTFHPCFIAVHNNFDIYHRKGGSISKLFTLSVNLMLKGGSQEMLTLRNDIIATKPE